MSRLLLLALVSISTLVPGCATTKQDVAQAAESKKEQRASTQLASDAARQHSKDVQRRVSKINP